MRTVGGLYVSLPNEEQVWVALMKYILLNVKSIFLLSLAGLFTDVAINQRSCPLLSAAPQLPRLLRSLSSVDRPRRMSCLFESLNEHFPIARFDNLELIISPRVKQPKCAIYSADGRRPCAADVGCVFPHAPYRAH